MFSGTPAPDSRAARGTLAGCAGAPGEIEDQVENGNPILVPNALGACSATGELETHKEHRTSISGGIASSPAENPAAPKYRLEMVAKT